MADKMRSTAQKRQFVAFFLLFASWLPQLFEVHWVGGLKR